MAPDEIRPIIELGRARAWSLTRCEDFRAGLEALAPELLKWRMLPGEIVESILAEATGKPTRAEQLASEALSVAELLGDEVADFLAEEAAK